MEIRSIITTKLTDENGYSGVTTYPDITALNKQQILV